MRNNYQEQMTGLSRDLLSMTNYIEGMIHDASEALLKTDLELAEKVISSIDVVEDLRSKSEAHAVELLALEAPVARDLRQIVSGLYIVEDLTRMATLAVHIARIARRRYPDAAVPKDLNHHFEKLAKLDEDITKKLYEVLENYDAHKAIELTHDDDKLDKIHKKIFKLTTKKEWEYTTTNAVDVTLLSRFYERYADHAVEIANRVVYLATGYYPEEMDDDTLRAREDAYSEEEFKRRYENTDEFDTDDVDDTELDED